MESKEWLLTAEDVAEVLGSDPQTLRLMGRDYPERIGFNVMFRGNRMYIPRIAFLKAMTGEVRKEWYPC